MKLVINCTIDRIENGQIKSFQKEIIIENLRERRKNINKNTIVEYFYRKFKDLYLRRINEIRTA